MKTSETLAKAKSLIADPANWFKGDWVDDDNPECMCGMGAVAKASGLSFEGSEMLKVIGSKFEFYLASAAGYEIPEASMYNKIQNIGPLKFGRFAMFNDKEATTHEMVMVAFDKAIALAEADKD